MKTENFSFLDAEDWSIQGTKWTPDGKVRGAVNLAHGMAEHGGRYERLAKALTDRGFAVYVQDLRGHGRTAGKLENLGFIGSRHAFQEMIDDLHQLSGIIRAEQPDVPLFIMGHSFGSFLAQGYIERYGKEVRGAILSGTTGAGGTIYRMGKALAALIVIFRGADVPSPLLERVSTGGYDRPFAPNRTSFDWLSRDDDAVDRYVADPFCGFTCTTSFYRELCGGLLYVHRESNRRRIPKDLPVYLFAGSRDPVGGMGKGFLALVAAYRELGIADVEYNLYDGARHELLNETNRDEATADLLTWLDRHVP